MKESVNRFRNPNSFFRVLFAALIISTLGLATLPAHAGDAEADAQKAFDNWKAAKAKATQKQQAVDDVKKELATYLAQIKDDKQITASEQEGLDALNAKLADAEAELKAAEAELMDAFNALTEALAKLPEDSELRKELLRQRGILMGDKQTSLAPQAPQMVQTKTAGGLQVTTFTRPEGRITLNLPDDIRAGDTISGTVIAEPKGETREERAKNLDVLNGLVIEINNKRMEPFPSEPAKEREAVIQQTFWLYHADAPKVGPAPNAGPNTAPNAGPNTAPNAGPNTAPNAGPNTAPNAHAVHVSLLSSDGKVIAQTTLSPFIPPYTPTDAFPYTSIPPLGQTGRPVVITGPFDGNSSNTQIDYGPAIRTPAGGRNRLDIVAESPRKVVVIAPTDSTGPTQIKVNENGVQTIGNFRNLGVNLSAPKTQLRRGESTTLKVEVSGLQGITEPVPLHLTKGGVVNMQGGDAQTMSIKPAEVSSSGTFTTTRTITGMQAGGWNATATVVVYNVCLQDDGDPLRVLLFMTTTGDFKFCPGHSSGGGAAPIPLTSTDFTGGISLQAGDGLDAVTRTGAIMAADFKFAGGQMKFQVDDSAHSGNATVKTAKQTFTITDRDTRNNTCTCK